MTRSGCVRAVRGDNVSVGRCGVTRSEFVGAVWVDKVRVVVWVDKVRV